MAAPILWAPRISVFFLQENLYAHKIPRFGGRGILGLGGGGADLIFTGAGIFLRFRILGSQHQLMIKKPHVELQILRANITSCDAQHVCLKAKDVM